MPRIMTVDDSRAVRTIVSKQMKELGFEIDEAEDGQQALEKLEDVACDLILLDVTMPVMDGPTMLAKLRERGDKTPVIMLTSESKRSVVSEAMKLGIDDYILKPFKPEELLGKVRASLKSSVPSGPAAASAPVASAPAVSAPVMSEVGPAGSKRFIDVMVIDDMENVAKRLKSMLPPHVTLEGFTSAQSALAACHEGLYRVVLIDHDIPDVDSVVLAGQVRILQPHVTVLALGLRTAVANPADLKAKGFADVLFKPFTQEVIEDFVMQYFDKQELLISEDNLLKVGPFVGRQDRLDRYFSRLGALFPPALEKVAAACFEDAIVDLSNAVPQPDRLPRLMISVAAKAKDVGLQVRLVAAPDVEKILAGFEETKTLPVFQNLTEARAG